MDHWNITLGFFGIYAHHLQKQAKSTHFSQAKYSTIFFLLHTCLATIIKKYFIKNLPLILEGYNKTSSVQKWKLHLLKKLQKPTQTCNTVMLLHTDHKPLYSYQLYYLSIHSTNMKGQQYEAFAEVFQIIPLHNSYNTFQLLLFTSHVKATLSLELPWVSFLFSDLHFKNIISSLLRLPSYHIETLIVGNCKTNSQKDR